MDASPTQQRRAWFSRGTSNALIAAASTIIAALVAAFGVRERSRNNLELEIVQLRADVADKQNDLTRLSGAVKQQADELAAVKRHLMEQRSLGDNGTDTNSVVTVASTSESTTSPTDEVDGFRITLHGCSRSGATVVCQISVYNKGPERQFFLDDSSLDVCRAVDDQGNQYTVDNTAMGGDKGRPWARIPSDVTVRGRLSFRDVAREAAKFSVLQVNFQVDSRQENRVEFRNVWLSTG